MKYIKGIGTELWVNRYKFIVCLGILIFIQFTIQYRPLIVPRIYIIIILIALLFLFAFSRLKDSNKLAWNAFVIIMSLGIVNALSMPVRQNLDENTHFFYASQIADGNLFLRNITQSNYLESSPTFLAETQLPSRIEDGGTENTNLYTQKFMKIKNTEVQYKKVNIGGIAAFANPVYYPSALGIALGRLISPYFFVSYYLGRIFNLLMYAILAFVAIKISKKYKLPLFVFSLIPYTVWISAGYNYDSLFYGLSLLIIAQLTNFFAREKLITMRSIIVYVMSCVALVLCKAPMVLLVTIPLFLPKDYFDKAKTKLYSFLFAGIGGILSFLWVRQWLIISELRKFLGIAREVKERAIPSDNAIALSHRLDYFIDHPIYTLTLLLRTILDIPANIYNTLAIPQPFMQRQFPSEAVEFFNIVLLTILIIIISYRLDFTLPKRMNFVILGIIGIITAGVIYAMSGDDRTFVLGDLVVGGVQGRYHFYALLFLPFFIAPAVRYLFGQREVIKDIEYDKKIQNFIVYAVLLLTFVNTCVGLFGYL